MKSVLISIQPKWCELIASGKKTVEVRKTKPKLETPFKVYIYCTKNKEKLIEVIHDGDDVGGFVHRGKPNFIKTYDKDWSLYGAFKGGKVIGEFVCDDIYDIIPSFDSPTFPNAYICGWEYGKEFHCLSFEEITSYLKGKQGFGWHISDLKIYDKPRELWEFKTTCKEYGSDNPNCTECHYYIDGMCYEYDESDCGCSGKKPITRPPQSWCYVERSE